MRQGQRMQQVSLCGVTHLLLVQHHALNMVVLRRAIQRRLNLEPVLVAAVG